MSSALKRAATQITSMMKARSDKESRRVGLVHQLSEGLTAAGNYVRSTQRRTGSVAHTFSRSCNELLDRALEGIPNWQIHAPFIEAILLEEDAEAAREAHGQRSADHYASGLAPE